MKLKDFHCEICKDRQYIEYKDEEGCNWAKPCQCQKIRKSLWNAEHSGLGALLETYTFTAFKTDLAFQKDMYDKAKQYIDEAENKWFVVLGKTGSGKSHICTAICSKFLNKGYEVKFMSWIEDSRRLKSHINDDDYDDLISQYKNAEVLYIDDFFKSENNTAPTNADIKLAIEILNYRYNKARISDESLKTIISSERLIEQLVSYDEAIAGRIVEMADNYLVLLKNASNYRLRKFY